MKKSSDVGKFESFEGFVLVFLLLKGNFTFSSYQIFDSSHGNQRTFNFCFHHQYSSSLRKFSEAKFRRKCQC